MKIQTLVVLLLFFGCSRKASFDPKAPKKLNQISGVLTHFDPQLRTDLATSIQLDKVYESLFEVNYFDPPMGLLLGLAAAPPDISKDGKTYIFRIRKNVAYHPCPCFNGKKRYVLAEDFVTTFKRIAHAKFNSPHYGYWKSRIVGLEKWRTENKDGDWSVPLEGVQTLDSHLLQIQIPERNPHFLNLMVGSAVAPIPMEAVTHFKNDLSKNIVGTGPFILKSYLRGSRIEYDKNPNYRKRVFPKVASAAYAEVIRKYANVQIPIIDHITVHIIKESQTGWLNFQKGKIDYLEVPKDNFTETFTQTKNLTPEMTKKGMIKGVGAGLQNTYYFGLNTKHPILQKVKVRRAIAHTFNRWEFNKLFFNNTATPAYSILPPGIHGNEPFLAGPYLKPNLEMGKKLLAEAGHPNGKGVPELTITVKNKTISRQVGDYLVKELSQLGIVAKTEAVEWGRVLQKIQKGQFDIFYLAWFVGIPAAHEFFELVYGPNHPDSYNRVGYQNPVFDRFFKLSRQEPDATKRGLLIRKMNRMIQEDVPLIPLLHSNDFFVRQGWLQNYVPGELVGGLEKFLDIDRELKAKLLPEF